jgi:hypothetical protein
MTYSVELLNDKGEASYLSVKGKSEWKTKRIAEKHCSDIRFVIAKCGHFAGAIVANVEEN